MLQFNLIGAGMLAAMVLIHAAGTFWWTRLLSDHFADRDGHWRRGASLWILIAREPGL